MAHPDRSDPLAARGGSPGLARRAGDDAVSDDGAGACQLDMFGPPPTGSAPDLDGLRAELIEILPPETPEDEVAQLRLEFLMAELARLNAA